MTSSSDPASIRRVFRILSEPLLEQDDISDLGAVDDETAALLASHLERLMSGQPLERIERVWDLTRGQVATMFGVHWRTYESWKRDGMPHGYISGVELVDDATQILVSHVRLDRIPELVRSPLVQLDDRSLVELLEQGRFRQVRNEVVAMFDLRGSRH